MVISFFRIDKLLAGRYTKEARGVNTVLDSKDLEILQTMMTQIVAASEARMSAKIEDSIAASEARMSAKIAASESKIMAYIESDVLPRFDILADGHKLLKETLAPRNRVEELEEEIAFLKPLVMSMLTDIDQLKKAQ